MRYFIADPETGTCIEADTASVIAVPDESVDNVKAMLNEHDLDERAHYLLVTANNQGWIITPADPSHQ